LRVDGAKADLETTGIELEVGQTAKIILPENPTTGYGWIINDDDAGDIFDAEGKYV